MPFTVMDGLEAKLVHASHELSRSIRGICDHCSQIGRNCHPTEGTCMKFQEYKDMDRVHDKIGELIDTIRDRTPRI